MSQEELTPQLDSLRTQIGDDSQRIADNESAIENRRATSVVEFSGEVGS